MFRLSVSWALVADDPIDEAALRGALRDLCAKHEALRTEMADPPLLCDIAMEAAGNLALLRHFLERRAGGTPAVVRSVLRAAGSALYLSWPRVAVRDSQDTPVPLDIVRCESQEQIGLRSTWPHGRSQLTEIHDHATPRDAAAL